MSVHVDRIIATGIDPSKVMTTWLGTLHADGSLSVRIEAITITDGKQVHRVTRSRIESVAMILESSPGLFG